MVFVPMFRECSFTHGDTVMYVGGEVFVPMFRECSFTQKRKSYILYVTR